MSDHVPETEAVERFEMRTNFSGVVQLLARNLYPEPDAFVRELIQNAHDGIQRRRQSEPALQGRIRVAIDPPARTLTFVDNGVGMDRQDIHEFLSVIGATGTGAAREALQAQDVAAAQSLIGQFGIGTLAAFVVASRITVHTRRIGTEDGWLWENSGSAECLLQPVPKEEPGTTVTVHIGKEFHFMLRRRWVADTIQRYCDFIPFPIELDGSGQINAVDAPWHLASWPDASARASAYATFATRYFREEPLEVIPIEIDEPIRTRGVLFISKGRIPDVNAAGMIDLYIRRMFIRARDPELLPAWAKFVRGLVDTPDLVPTAARDNVQRKDANWTALQHRLGDLIMERLGDLAQQEPDRFRALCRVHGVHLASLAASNERFFERTRDHLLFETNRGLLPLSDCIAQDEPALYYFPADAGARQYYALANARGIVAVNARDQLEEELLVRFARTRDHELRLVRLDTSRDTLLLRTASLEAAGRTHKLVQAVAGALRRAGLSGLSIKVRRFEPVTRPAILLISPDAAADLRLSQLVDQTWLAESLQDLTRELLTGLDLRGLNLVINEDNALIQQMLREGSVDDDAHCMLLLAACLHARDVLTHEVAERLIGPLVRVLGAAMGTAMPPLAAATNRGEYAIAG
jgi:molecular chaperone HtpG